MQRISPFLWFDTQAEEAARFYVSIFPNSRITKVTRYNEALKMKKIDIAGLKRAYTQ